PSGAAIILVAGMCCALAALARALVPRLQGNPA
ncbi:MAG: metal ABC transporter permease, partial [Pseudomonas putida]